MTDDMDLNYLDAAKLDSGLPLGIHAPKLDGDVGYDLVAMKDVTLRPFEALDVPVNARLRFPPGVWGEIRARSSIVRRGLQVEAGVIDNGYRGPLFVLLRNMTLPSGSPARSGTSIEIKAGERVGQLVLHQIVPNVLLQEVMLVEETTARGSAGFGSTGVA